MEYAGLYRRRSSVDRHGIECRLVAAARRRRRRVLDEPVAVCVLGGESGHCGSVGGGEGPGGLISHSLSWTAKSIKSSEGRPSLPSIAK